MYLFATRLDVIQTLKLKTLKTQKEPVKTYNKYNRSQYGGRLIGYHRQDKLLTIKKGVRNK